MVIITLTARSQWPCIVPSNGIIIIHVYTCHVSVLCVLCILHVYFVDVQWVWCGCTCFALLFV